MLNEEERQKLQFTLLMDEKKHVDEQISGFMDWQIKTLTFIFTALGVAAGWLVSTGKTNSLSPGDKANILVLIATVSCFALLLIGARYGMTLAYIYDKNVFLTKQFKELLGLENSPLSNSAFAASPGNQIIRLSTVLLWVVIFGFEIVLLIWAWILSGSSKLLVAFAASLVLLTLVLVAYTVKAMRQTEAAGASGK